MKRSRLRSYLAGAARLMDFAGTLPFLELPARPRHASVEAALRSDWEAIGGDLRRVIAMEESRVRPRRP